MDVPSADQFRQDFPEFSSRSAYADPLLTFWLTVGSKLVNEQRWGDLAPLAVELMAAHNIILEARAMREGLAGKVPGFTQGVLTSKSVDKVSAGYADAGNLEADAGHWALSIYGMRYIRLARLHGAGPVQVGVPAPGCNVSAYGYGASGAAWPGPGAPWW